MIIWRITFGRLQRIAWIVCYIVLLTMGFSRATLACAPEMLLLEIDQLARLPDLSNTQAVAKILHVHFREETGPLIDLSAALPSKLAVRVSSYVSINQSPMGAISMSIKRDASGKLSPDSPLPVAVSIIPKSAICITACNMAQVTTGRPAASHPFQQNEVETFYYDVDKKISRVEIVFDGRSLICASRFVISQ